MSAFLADVRFALRQLLRRPGFTVLAIGTLAIGTGAATAIFSIVDGVLLRPLPFPASRQLVALCETHPTIEGYCANSPPDVEDWAARSRTIVSFGLGRSQSMKLTPAGGEPAGVGIGIATPGLCRTLGVGAAMGRLFTSQDLEPSGRNVVVLTDELWRAQFGASRRIIGATLQLDDQRYTVIGVLPAGVEVPTLSWAKAWLPLPFSPRAEENRRWRGFVAFGRLAPGASVASAQAELQGIQRLLAEQHPATNTDWSVKVQPLLDRVVGGVRPTLLVFLGAVAILVLVACANVANLLVARGASREREFALRAALGARPVRLFRLIALESGVTALAGGAFGIIVAAWAADALLALMPAGLPRVSEVHLDLRVLAFALLLTVVTAMLTGLAPAWRASRLDLVEAIKESHQPRAWRRALGVRGGLVVAEVAFAFVLAVGAGLLARSFAALLHWDPGFETQGVLTFWTYASTGKFAQVPGRFAHVEEELRALPGVTGVGMTSAGPLFGGGDGAAEYTIVGEAPAPGGPIVASWYDMSPGYFRTLGIALRRGRYFDGTERADGPQVAIVNETLARRWFAGRDPVGLRIVQKNHPDPIEIVGVVADVPPFTPGAAASAEVYWPFAQQSRWASYFVLRATPGADLAALAKLVEQRLKSIDPDLTPSHVATMDDLVGEQLRRPRFNLLLIGVFAAMAVALTVVGVYGVIAASVVGRTREMGVRIALGASRPGVIGMVMREGLWLTMAGVAAGALAASAVSRLAGSMLVGVRPTDPPTYVAIAALLVLAAAAACFIPARRAALVDPMEALRAD
jgi:predicted permease